MIIRRHQCNRGLFVLFVVFGGNDDILGNLIFLILTARLLLACIGVFFVVDVIVVSISFDFFLYLRI
ncbi:hypothetical protein BKA69DRAFT_1084675 [Paraphysoderma sedebokerense]|nr:hypothetical protein BKA69DRAFT_1084655 [Paraphysoderma sedebokerense]KAI9139575.1 hypothetical protein BKA69DRAFT_1084675 [Paraphysoderma sedebokerense]